jgi:signal transduction histidine kinase/CheY-like chemotaxis protein/ligand-binding sensor domain-containing protein
MRKNPPYLYLRILCGLILLALVSCNNQVADIPFPVSDSAYPQPVTQTLQLGAPKKLDWVQTKTGLTQPAKRKLDLNALPSMPYDTNDLKPFPKAPITTHFDFNGLPDTVLDLDKLPVQSLQFKTRILAPPVLFKSGLVSPKTGTTINVSNIGGGQGLPDKSILCLMKDKKGFIWIGTQKSLYRYDGSYMLNYESFKDGVTDLLEDREGRIWYINDNGIGVIDPMAGTVSSSDAIFTVNPALPKMILDEKGQIWISRITMRGIAIIDPQKFTFKHLQRSDGLSDINIWGLYEDGQKNIWATGRKGVNIINPERNKIRFLTKHNGLASDTVRAITGDPEGRVWIAVEPGGVSVVDVSRGAITNYGKEQGFENIATYRLVYDDLGQVWMGSSRGLSELNIQKGQYRNFTDREGIPEEYVLDLVQDNQHNIWLATFNGGLQIIDQYGEMIHPLGTLSMSTIMEDAEGKVWIGTANNHDAIQILDKEKKRIRQLDKQHGIGDNFIQNLLQFNGKIWVTSYGGLDIIDPVNHTLEHFGKNEGLTTDSLYNAIGDGKGNKYFTGPAMGVDRMDSAKKTMYHVGIKQGLSDNFIADIHIDKKGRIWLATQTKGVDLIDLEKGTIQNLNQGPGLKDTCNRLLMPDPSGRMWIGTDKGISVVDLDKNTITQITTKEGLCDNNVLSLILNGDKVIAGTKNKVAIIDPPSFDNQSPAASADTVWKFAVLKGSEGLIATSNNWNTNMLTRSGQYYWGDAGITIIHGIQEQKEGSALNVTGVTIMNQPRHFNNRLALNEHDTLWTDDKFYVKGQTQDYASLSQQNGFIWDSVTGPYNIPVNLQIPYDQNYIQFQFGRLYPGAQDEPIYSYILEGIDKSWSPFSTRTVTDNYLNLSPGNYIFKVRTKEASGFWSSPASFAFTVTPPWWKTWWMYLIYLIALISAFLGYNKYRSLSLIKENRVLEEKIQARTLEVKQQADELSTVNQISQALVSQADLHDLIRLVGNQLKDLFRANIVYIAMLDKKTKMISFPYQHGDNMAPLKLGEGLTSKIILSGEPLLINEDVKGQVSELGINRVGRQAASYLGVPIPVADEIIGVLSIQSTESENCFADKDKHLLSTIAANVGVAIKRARLFEEVKQANTEAGAARKIAEEANAAKSAFLSTVSHELRTPLTSVLGFAKITKKRLEEKIFPITDTSDPKTVKTIEQISGNLGVVISEGERLTNLINDVLDLAKIEAGKMEWNIDPVFIPDIVERAIAATSSLFEQKNLKLETKIEGGLPEITGDRDKLIQVVVNLLSNAVKFTNQGTVTCSVFQKADGIVVGITDTGIGIAPEDHDKVFEQFKQVGDTLTDKPKGTGLGLPICKEIVEHHGGKIWLESELGHGSTFYFMLPLQKTDAQGVRHIQLNDLVRQLKKRVEKSHLSTVQNKKATILVVDDDDGIRSLLKQELGEAGYQIEEASNGKEAVTKIRNIRPDLVILDVMMPEMNGFDVAAILKNDPQTMEIPIIILSIVQDKSRGFRIGVDRYLTKPIDTDLLFSEIGDLLEQGKSRKKVMVVDEDIVTVRTLTDVLEAKGYQVVESDGKELVERAIEAQPDIIILNSVISDKHEIVKTIRFEKGLENVLFLIYQ